MATFQQRGGRWRAIVRIQGITDSATFDRKTEAARWATQREHEIVSGAAGRIPDKTFGDLLLRYRNEVSAGKRGERWERIRIERFVLGRPDDGVSPDPIVHVRLPVLNATHVAAWRDRRLRVVQPASVRREWNLLSAACGVAIREWQWLHVNPMSEVRRPEKPPARVRRVSPDEIERIMFCAGYSANVPPRTMTARIGAAFLFAIETGMRAGEICALAWQDVFIEQRFCRITGVEVGSGKTQSARRDVALSTEAMRLMRQLRAEDVASVFRISSTQSLDALFRKVRDKAGVEDLHFHDTRHEAITRLSKKMDVLSLARMVGHRNINELMTYYNESATDIAARLD